MIECEVIMGRILEYMMLNVSVAVRMLWVDEIDGTLVITLTSDMYWRGIK